jgi:hypothetical protein
VKSKHVIAAATVANVAVSVLLFTATYKYTQVTKEIFEAGYRPYLVVQASQKTDDAKKIFFVVLTVTNDGNVGANVLYEHSALLLGGQAAPAAEPSPSEPENHSLVSPHAYFNDLFYLSPSPNYDKIKNGTLSLDFVLDIKYQGVGNEKYCYYVKHRWEPAFRAWRALEISTVCK